MSRTALVLAAALALAAPAAAETLKPMHGASLELGEVTGVAYYVHGSEGDRVVVTLARADGLKPVRFETILSEDQRVAVSVPDALGSIANRIEISRIGGRISIAPLLRTANAK